MRKKFLSVAGMLAFGTAVMFTSCSNDDDIVNGGIGNVENADVQTITLQVVNSGDKFASTRAGRPLLSSESGQEIDKVDFIVYNNDGTGVDNGKIVLKKTLNWTASSVIGTGTPADGSVEHGKYMTLELKGDEKLPDGHKYVIYAIGYTSTGSSYGYETAAPFNAVTVGTSTFSDPYKATSTTAPAADEIFAGSGEMSVPDAETAEEGQSGVTGTVVLRRQVTGTFGYFKNIPYQNVEGTKTGTKLRLVASAANKTITFENFSNSITTEDANVDYVVNGSDAVDKDAKFFGSSVDDGVVIYEAKFAEWFSKSMADLDMDKDGFVSLTEGATAWTKPVAYNGKATFMKGTMFGSSFLVPVLKTNDHQTLQLQLVDDSGNILRYWNINLQATEDQLDETIGTVQEDENSYSLVRNHLYTVGQKFSNDNPTNPGTDPDPDPDPDPDDPDQPGDLSAGQNLIIKVNDNWEVVHNMAID